MTSCPVEIPVFFISKNNYRSMEAKKSYLCSCIICGKQFNGRSALNGFCSDDCRRARKREKDKAYRMSELGQATRRKNRKNPGTIATRKRYEQTQAFKESKHRRNKIYMQRPESQDMEKVRKLNYYYSHYSKKFNLYNPNAYRITLADIKKLYAAENCYYCERKLTEDEKTVDHKLPVSRGGTNDMQNLVICCQKCNSKKSDRTEEEYRRAS